MNIEVLFFGQLRDLTDSQESAVSLDEGARLADLLEHLGKMYGVAFSRQVKNIQGLRILINGREYSLLGGVEASLKDGDTVVLLPPIAGG